MIIAKRAVLCYSEAMTTFTDLTIRENLTAHIAQKGITEPTAVQSALIPRILNNENIVFRSETGTGKTLAFLLPLFTRLLNERQNELENGTVPTVQPRILIVAPTHELASQIKAECEYLCTADSANPKLKAKSALFIGGASVARQIETLKTKPQIIVGGPARLTELIQLKKLKTQHIFALVLDEVDRLLSPELRDFTTGLIKCVPNTAQLIACSATIKPNITRILQEASGKTLKTELLPQEDVLKSRITHWAFHAEKRDKIDTLRSFLNAETPTRALVFSADTSQIENIVSKLTYKKINCAALYSKTDKEARKKAIDSFRNGKCPVLVTSDLAARGLDIHDVTHIVQMDVPKNDDFFVHRAGRTARAGKTGINAIIGDEWELRRLASLEKKLGIVVYPKVLYGGKITTPHTEEAE